MIAIDLICVGNIKEKFFCDALSEYQKRLKAFCNLNIIEIKETNYFNPTFSEIEKIKIDEGKKIISKMGKFNVLLSLNGKEFTSTELSNYILNKQNETSKLTFIIGGSYGVSQEVEDKSDFKLSFSHLTFPHQLMRVIFLEQLYRSFTIMYNKSYHK